MGKYGIFQLKPTWIFHWIVLMSFVTLKSFLVDVRAISELSVFCCFTWALKESTFAIISLGIWLSFTFVVSFFPSTAFGCVRFVSIPPRPVFGSTVANGVIPGVKVEVGGTTPKPPKLGNEGTVDVAGFPNVLVVAKLPKVLTDVVVRDVDVPNPKDGGAVVAGAPRPSSVGWLAVVSVIELPKAGALVVGRKDKVAGTDEVGVENNDAVGCPKLKEPGCWVAPNAGGAVTPAWPNPNPVLDKAVGCWGVICGVVPKLSWVLDAGVLVPKEKAGGAVVVGFAGCPKEGVVPKPNEVDCCGCGATCCWGWGATEAVGVPKLKPLVLDLKLSSFKLLQLPPTLSLDTYDAPKESVAGGLVAGLPKLKLDIISIRNALQKQLRSFWQLINHFVGE